MSFSAPHCASAIPVPRGVNAPRRSPSQSNNTGSTVIRSQQYKDQDKPGGSRDSGGAGSKLDPVSQFLKGGKDTSQLTELSDSGASLQDVQAPSSSSNDDILRDCANAVRTLTVDAVNHAKAGHPGAAMGLAPLGALLFSEVMRHNPEHPGWMNRDRFVMSNGHACLLQYSLLHLSGYDLQIDDLKGLCKLGSRTPGHPENHVTAGIEVVTGPLGQGFANAVGLALAESMQAATWNTHHHRLVDHYTYVVFGDGCAMEGISNEAASLAGHWGLGKLIAFYDDNHVTIDGPTSIAFSEDVGARYAALGWHVQKIKADQYGDFQVLREAINNAKMEMSRPSLIQLETVIGFGSPSKEGTPKAHHGAFGDEESRKIREKLGVNPDEEPFTVPEHVYQHMRSALHRGKEREAEWSQMVEQFLDRYPNKRDAWDTCANQELPRGWEKLLPKWTMDDAPGASRTYSERCLNSLASGIPNLVGGSADLASSNLTLLREDRDYSKEHPEGRNIRFGIREHAMGAISVGLALHGTGLIPFCSTFLVFSDYMKGAIRLSALSGAGVIYLFTHDSIGLGEDGPTHQPVEHLPALRAIPNLYVVRPGDGNETSGAWKLALSRPNAPTAIVLSRQKMDAQLEGSSVDNVSKGAYVLRDWGKEGESSPSIVLIASGAEVVLCQDAARQLHEKGVSCRLVSLVCWEAFRGQPKEYRDSVLPPSSLRLGVEAASSFGWAEWLGSEGKMISVDKFGMSASYLETFKEYGFTASNVVETSLGMLKGGT